MMHRRVAKGVGFAGIGACFEEDFNNLYVVEYDSLIGIRRKVRAGLGSGLTLRLAVRVDVTVEVWVRPGGRVRNRVRIRVSVRIKVRNRFPILLNMMAWSSAPRRFLSLILMSAPSSMSLSTTCD